MNRGEDHRSLWGIGLRIAGALAVLASLIATPALADPSFNVTLPASADAPVTGRLIVVVAGTDVAEPRTAISFTGPPAFGVDVDALAPGAAATVDQRADGYPFALPTLPPGEYNVQALLIRYTLAKRADGKSIWVPFPRRRVMPFMMEGTYFSPVQKVRIDPRLGKPIPLTLSETIPAMPERVETPWVKHVRIPSKILSDFWGVPMSIGASVLLPKGWAERPNLRYPAVYVFGHGDVPFGFTTDPKTDTEGARASAADANVKTGYAFGQDWQGANFPRMVAITLETPGPYFVESYALNSANNGPWGDAITRELIPYLEQRFRLIAAPHGRIVEGASTGGWEALALQTHYPDFFGGAWVFNPDPIDFTRYQLTDIYRDDNMFTTRITAWRTTDRPFRRTREGQPTWSVRDLAMFEAMLGSNGRSGYQLGIWQATHGPTDARGYPRALFDPRTGIIDREVADYYRSSGFDLTDHVRSNWATLGPKLRGKINLFAGEMDDFYLNLGVYGFEEMVRAKGGADYPIRFEYGRSKKGHNWHHKDWAGVLREMADHVRRTAPAGATTGWDH